MEALLQKIQDRIATSVNWTGQIVFEHSGAILPLSVSLASVEQSPNLPRNNKYNPRAVLQLRPMHNSCVRFPTDGVFRLILSAAIKGSEMPSRVVYDQWVPMSQLRSQASM